MNCPHCGYWMSPLDTECPRCHHKIAVSPGQHLMPSTSGAAPPRVPYPSQAAYPPQAPYLPQHTPYPPQNAGYPPTGVSYPIAASLAPSARATAFQHPALRIALVFAVLVIPRLAYFALTGGSLAYRNSREPHDVITTMQLNSHLLVIGHSYSRVESDLGSAGNLTKTDYVSGALVKTYQWKNSDGSYLQCTFNNDKLADAISYGVRH